MFHLDKGIFLEDKNVLLDWGQSVEKLATDNNAKVIRQGDRTIVEWGTHTILNGLQLDLSNTYLLSRVGQFDSIQFKTVGDKESFEKFDLISNHLVKVFGAPSEKEDDIETNRERCWTWSTADAKITLYLFEQHAFKLSLTIGQA